MTNDKLLISLVKRNPVLYDRNVTDFNNKAKKDFIWKGIAECLSISVAQAQTRWVTLRTLFCRELRMRKHRGSSLSDTSAELGRKGWPLFDQMMFIQPYQRSGTKTTTDKKPSSLDSSIDTPTKVWAESCPSWSADELEAPIEIETSNDGSNQHHFQPVPTIASTSPMQSNHIPLDPLGDNAEVTCKMEGVYQETTALMKETITLLSSREKNGNDEGATKTERDAEVAAMVQALRYPLLRVPEHLRTLCLTELLTVIHKFEENS